MQYTNLGTTGAKVSRIALGTMNFGRVIDSDASFAIMDAAVAAGVNFFDNANIYGGPALSAQTGLSEKIQGEWMTARGSRDDLVVATKVHGIMGAGPNERGLSAIHIRAAVDASLRRLQTDRIDLYQMHHIVRDHPIDEILEAFELLHQQGKVLYIGSSNFPGWFLAHFQERANRHRLPRLATEQSVYSLANRAIEAELIPAAAHYGVGILPYAPLAGGLLGGILTKPETGRSAGMRDKLGERRGAVERFEELARTVSLPPGQLALAWLLRQPQVTAPIVGPRTLEQFADGVAATEVELSEETMTALDEIWPGPGVAPESYAW